MNTNKNNSKVGGILIGIILVIVGVIVLWLNEGRTVKTYNMINEAQKEYIDVTSTQIDVNNNGKLIATNGEIKFLSGPVDNEFNIHVQSPKLYRKVEIYQWKENCDEDRNGNKRCHYNKVWDDEIIDSNTFEDANYINPTSKPYSNSAFYASNVQVGAYSVDEELLKQLNTNVKLNLSDNQIATTNGLYAINNYYTNVQNNTPQIGDIRISYTYASTQTASILAVQNNSSFRPYKSKDGYQIYELEEGTLNGSEILKKLSDENNMTKWILRLVGSFLVIFGLLAIVSPVQKLANFIPIVGTIFGWISGLAVLIVGLAISLSTIAIAWLRYRPLLSVGLLAAVAVIIVMLKKSKTKKDNVQSVNQTLQNEFQSNLVDPQTTNQNNIQFNPQNNINFNQQNNVNQNRQE